MMTFGNSYWQRREPLVPREQMWGNEEAKSIEERRRRYRCRGKYVTLEEIAPWVVYREGIAERQKQEKEAHRRWLAQRKEAYRRRKLQHEARKQRIAEKKQRKAEREEKRRVARQIKEEAKALQQREQQAQKEQEEKQVEQPTEATTAAGVEASTPEDVKVNVEDEEAKREEKKEDDDANSDDSDSDSDSDDEKNQDDDEEDDLSTSSEWSELSTSEEEPSSEEEEAEEKGAPVPTAHFAPDEELNRIVTMWRGDITQLEIDAIVNAANRSLLGGGGIDGAIHRAAGDDLYNECRQLNGCVTGHCKISRGYALPAKYVIHTVGPIGEHPVALRSCYLNCLRVAVQNGVRSLAFCGISTGIYGYPLYEASHIALKTVRRWLEEGDNRTKFDSIIFCVFLDKERICYERLLPLYFPSTGAPYEVLPMQPGEEREVPPMVEQDSSSSDDDSDSDDDGEDEGIPDAPPPPPPNAANEAVTTQLAAGVEALAISAPETAHEGAEAPATPTPEATPNANDAGATAGDTDAAPADPAAAVANP